MFTFVYTVYKCLQRREKVKIWLNVKNKQQQLFGHHQKIQ